MFSSTAQAEFKCLLKTFSTAKRAEYGDYAYASGYFESLASAMFRSLSKAEQKLFVRQMEREVEKATAAMQSLVSH
jgi:hypothetical protein